MSVLGVWVLGLQITILFNNTICLFFFLVWNIMSVNWKREGVLAKEEEEHVCLFVGLCVCVCVSIIFWEERPDLGMKLFNNYS